jgi:hypothetical protein
MEAKSIVGKGSLVRHKKNYSVAHGRAPQNLYFCTIECIISVTHQVNMRHRNKTLCGAHDSVRHKNSETNYWI